MHQLRVLFGLQLYVVFVVVTIIVAAAVVLHLVIVPAGAPAATRNYVGQGRHFRAPSRHVLNKAKESPKLQPNQRKVL